MASEEKRGIACKVSLECFSCTYTSPKQKLYAEVDTGRRGPEPAETNIGKAVATQNISIGPTKVQTLIGAGLTMLDSMKQAAQLVSQKTTKLKQADIDRPMKAIYCDSLLFLF